MSCAVDYDATSNHTEEFLNGWVSGIYAAVPPDYEDEPNSDLYLILGIDRPKFAPPIADIRRHEESLHQSATGAASFNRGWICGAARSGIPLAEISAKTGIGETEIQQIVIREWGMIWRCRVGVEEPPRIPEKGHDGNFEFDRPCSDFSEDYILFAAKKFLENLCQQRYSFEDMTGWSNSNQSDIPPDSRLETQAILRDIRCAIANGLDVGMLFTIARIKWVKKRCRLCKGRWALGNSTWKVPCISRRHESTPDAYKCNCPRDGVQTAWSGLFQPTVTDGTIRDATSIPPRRLWDVVTNRVILFGGKVSSLCQWCYDTATNPSHFELEYAAITHSWQENMSQAAILSPINSYLWPIPIPKSEPSSSGFDKVNSPIPTIVRHHLEERDIEYCWLCVLCLRQSGGIEEELRPREWEIDVPTIGNIYRYAITIVRYLNGLGKKVNKKVEAWNESRHWTNRAWTLQEIKPDDQMSTPDEATELNLMQVVYGTNPPQSIRQLLQPISRLAATANSPSGCGILSLVREIMKRSASNALDQVAGISYLVWPLGSQFDLPVYNMNMGVEAAWLKCVDSMRLESKLELLFLYPNPRADTPRKDIILDYILKLSNESTPHFYLQTMARGIWHGDGSQWIPTWQQLKNSTMDSVWDEIRLPSLSELRLSYTGHPLLVPTYLSNLDTPFGTFFLEGCELESLSPDESMLGPEAHTGGLTHKTWKITTRKPEEPDTYLVFRGYSPMDTALSPLVQVAHTYPDEWRTVGWNLDCSGHKHSGDDVHSLQFLDVGDKYFTGRYILLGLSLDIQAPWLVCLEYMDAMYLRTGDDSFKQAPSIVEGITVYDRTLILQKVAVMWTDERPRLARTFPQTMPWPKRGYDAIYIA